MGLLNGRVRLKLRVRARLQGVDGLPQAQLLGAGGRGTSGRGSIGLSGHITLEGVEIEPQVVGDVDGRDALAEVLEAVAGLRSREAGWEQLREIVRELGVLGQQLIWSLLAGIDGVITAIAIGAV